MLFSDETIDPVRRMKSGIPVDDEMLGLDAIHQVGADGEFLSHEHTLKHLRSTQWRPKLFSRMGFDKWQQTGSTDLLQRAQNRPAQILESHQPIPLAEEQVHAIQDRVELFKRNHIRSSAFFI